MSSTVRGLSTFGATRLVAWLTIRSALRARRVVFLLVLLAFPALVAAIMKRFGLGYEQGFLTLAPNAFFLLVAPLVALIHGASAFNDDVDDGTIVYLICRPISREALYLGKLLGAFIVASMMVLGALAAAWLPSAWQGDVGELLTSSRTVDAAGLAGVLVFSTAIYTALFSLFGMVLRRPVLIGIGFTTLVEIVFSSLPGPPSTIAVSHHAMRLLPKAFRTIERTIDEDLGTVPDSSTIVMGLALVLCLLIAAGLESARRSEFHERPAA